MVELDFEAVPLAAQRGDRGQRSVSLGPDPHIFVNFPVDHYGGIGVLLAGGIGDESIPVIHDNIHGMNLCVVKQPGLISHRMCHRLQSQIPAIHKQDCNAQDQDRGCPCDLVKMFAPRHTHHPM